MTLTDWLLVAIAFLQLIIIYQGRQLVAALDDLTIAVGSLETASTTIINKINQLKSTPGVDPVQVEALVARINTAVANINAAAV